MVTVLLGNILIIGVYFYPNRPVFELKEFLSEVEEIISQESSHPIGPARDLYVKSQAWGSPATNARGSALKDWLEIKTGCLELRLCKHVRKTTWWIDGGCNVGIRLWCTELRTGGCSMTLKRY